MAEVETLGGNAKERLKSFFDRLETLDDDRISLMADVKEVYAELKAEDFDPSTIRKLVALRRKDKAKRQEAQAIMDLYAHALGLDLF